MNDLTGKNMFFYERNYHKIVPVVVMELIPLEKKEPYWRVKREDNTQQMLGILGEHLFFTEEEAQEKLDALAWEMRSKIEPQTLTPESLMQTLFGYVKANKETLLEKKHIEFIQGKIQEVFQIQVH